MRKFLVSKNKAHASDSLSLKAKCLEAKLLRIARERRAPTVTNCHASLSHVVRNMSLHFHDVLLCLCQVASNENRVARRSCKCRLTLIKRIDCCMTRKRTLNRREFCRIVLGPECEMTVAVNLTCTYKYKV